MSIGGYINREDPRMEVFGRVEAMETGGRSSSGDGVRMALGWGVGGRVTGSRTGEGSNVDGEDIEQEGREE